MSVSMKEFWKLVSVLWRCEKNRDVVSFLSLRRR